MSARSSRASRPCRHLLGWANRLPQSGRKVSDEGFRNRGDLHLLPAVQGIVQGPRRIRGKARGLSEVRARHPHCKLNFGNPTGCAAPGNESAKGRGASLGNRIRRAHHVRRPEEKDRGGPSRQTDGRRPRLTRVSDSDTARNLTVCSHREIGSRLARNERSAGRYFSYIRERRRCLPNLPLVSQSVAVRQSMMPSLGPLDDELDEEFAANLS